MNQVKESIMNQVKEVMGIMNIEEEEMNGPIFSETY